MVSVALCWLVMAMLCVSVVKYLLKMLLSPFIECLDLINIQQQYCCGNFDNSTCAASIFNLILGPPLPLHTLARLSHSLGITVLCCPDMSGLTAALKALEKQNMIVLLMKGKPQTKLPQKPAPATVLLCFY